MKPWKDYEGYEEKLPNHVFVQRVASAAGVSNQSVHRVAKKRLEKEGKRDRKRLEGCPYTFVSLDLWDTYMQIGSVSRVASKPKGWVTAKSLLEDGFSKRKLYQFVADGQIAAVYVGNTLYLEPESARGYLQSRQSLRPPPGWVSVSELRTLAGRSKQAIFTYLKRHNVATKQFLHPKRDQLVQYLRQEDATSYLANMCSSDQPTEQCELKALHSVEQAAKNSLGLSYSAASEQDWHEALLAAYLIKEGIPQTRCQPFIFPGYPYPHPGSLTYSCTEPTQRSEPYEEASW
jgi:hypothetical protein